MTSGLQPAATPTRGAPGRNGCCLTFHRAASAAAWPMQPNRGFHLDITFLEHLLRHLLRTGWDIVTMDEAVRRMSTPAAKRFVNFSIDDCYRDTVELVVPLFRKLGAPVTLFVTTGIPDRSMRLRDAGLETILSRRAQVDDDGRAYRLNTDAERRAAFAAISARWQQLDGAEAEYERFCRRHGEDADQLDEQHRVDWPALERLAGDELVEVGGHTVSHPRVSTLADDAAADEIGGCRARLEAKLDRPVRHFAFPYGRTGDCGDRDFAIVRRAGFASAATTRKGLVRPGQDPFSLPRNTLNGNHRALAYAYAHLTGASGLAARALRRV